MTLQEGTIVNVANYLSDDLKTTIKIVLQIKLDDGKGCFVELPIPFLKEIYGKLLEAK